MDEENPYAIPREAFEDDAYREAQKTYQEGALVYVTRTKQVGMVREVRATADGPCVKGEFGLVPVSELRLATEDEVRDSQYGEQ